jgi:hypothetical protein
VGGGLSGLRGVSVCVWCGVVCDHMTESLAEDL